MKEKKITDPNLFMKLVLSTVMANDKPNALALMLAYKWEVFEEEETPHNYHIIGCHPICKRLDYYLTKTVIH